MSLETRTKQFTVVLNKPNNIDLIDFNNRLFNLIDYFNRNCYLFAMILHNKDKDSKKQLKTEHYHIVIKTSSIYRISTMLYRIADVLNYTGDQINTISIEKCDNLPASIQYLTHKNNKDKEPYNFKDIISNLSKNDLNDLYNQLNDTTITTQYLTRLVLDGKTDFEIMSIIGLGRYHLYKGALSDIRYAISKTPSKVKNFLDSVDVD